MVRAGRVTTILLTAVLLVSACSSTVTGEPSAAGGDSGQAPAPGGDSDTGSGSDSGGGAGSGYRPSEDNQDPAKDIEGVEIVDYGVGSKHTADGQRVAYDKTPPFGGAHDQAWADCMGTVYDKPVRTENMVHSLEHGAVWIAYDPDKTSDDDRSMLETIVEGTPYLMLSPYPGMDTPISMQSWGHQLKLDGTDDERIGHFITALRQNQYVTPEPGARCDADGTGFDVTDPPPFDPSAPGPDALPVDAK